MFPALLRDFNLNLHRKRRVADRDESSEDDVALTKLSKRKRSTSDLDTSSPSNQSLDTSTVKAEKPELISQPMEVVSESDDESLLQKRLRSLTNQTSDNSLPNQERNQRPNSNMKLDAKALVSNGHNNYKSSSRKSSTSETKGSPHTTSPLSSPPPLPPLPPPKTPVLKTSNQSMMEVVEAVGHLTLSFRNYNYNLHLGLIYLDTFI
ncbi:hypothetical protein BKA69DRAFT_696306 [Paraphysoderma sedebokerense]|nr:hypothetical protein BKA69DRAFT_696306 [Paraphysoderma sedebokerense]